MNNLNNIRRKRSKPKVSQAKDRQKFLDVTLEDGVFIFYHLNHPKVVSTFIRKLKRAIAKGCTSFILDFSKTENQVFPNAITPITGIIDFFRQKGMKFELSEHQLPIVRQSNILAPMPYDNQTSVLNKVWKFSSSEEVARLVDAFIAELSKNDSFYKGVLGTTEWSLNEVMDNVIQHSLTSVGYVMGQIHQTTKHIAFTVFDTGQGIYSSLKNTSHKPKNEVDAITLAIQEAVTRDKSIGQGNGLYGLHQICKQGNGKLRITSGQGYYSYSKESTNTYDNIPVLSGRAKSTTVDFIVDYSKDYSIDQALVFGGQRHTLVNLRIENQEDINGNIMFRMRDKSEGTGTRQAALRLKNEILNILIEEKKRIILDFEGVAVISSSYADELIAKLFCELGLFQFNQLIQIVGLNETQQSVLQHSVIQRIVENYPEYTSSKKTLKKNR